MDIKPKYKIMNSKELSPVKWLMENLTYNADNGERWIQFKDGTDLMPFFEDALRIEDELRMAAWSEGYDEGLYDGEFK